jgi:hypothetical protein
MNNDKYIVIKSLPQPDGGEGDSEWQGAPGNGRSEESHSENAGDAQVPRSADKTGTK